MMSRECRYILFIFFLIAAIDHKFIAAAEKTTTEGIIVRPVVEYASSKLRDPFRTYLIKDEPKPFPRENADLTKPALDLGKLEVQGIIWGVKIPQVIINNKVLTIGDLIAGAEILSIEKKGIVLSFNGAIFDLAAPGQGPVIKKEN